MLPSGRFVGFVSGGCRWGDHLGFAIVTTVCGPYVFRQLGCGYGEECYLPAPEASEGVCGVPSSFLEEGCKIVCCII